MAPRILSLAAAAGLAALAAAKATVGNFGISSTECDLFDIVVNPPAFGQYLTNMTDAAGFTFSVNGSSSTGFNSLFSGAQGDRVFPACRLSTVLPNGLILFYNAFAPVSPTDQEAGFIPTIIAQFRVVNNGIFPASFDASYGLLCDIAAGGCNGTVDSGSWPGAAYGKSGGMFVGAAIATNNGGSGSGTVFAGTGSNCTGGVNISACASFALSIPPSGSAHGSIIIGHHSKEGRYAETHPTAGALFRYAADNADVLAAGHSAFLGAVPSTGDPLTDQSVRWFLQAPLLLTKGVKNQSITMGYVELNQRDSFWSTWLHLHMWPGLDAEMIVESAHYQQPSGKIPTTVLPLILRDDNIDITEYWVVRVARHYQYTGNLTLLKAMYPAVQKALRYLKSRDFTGAGVPQALNSSIWADWMDVDYIQGRRYAPHYDLLYLAACRVGAQMATVLGDAPSAETYTKWYQAGYDFVNAEYRYVYNATQKAWDLSGMWNSSAGVYQDGWYDGRSVNWTMADVSVGVFMGVVPPARVLAIDDALHSLGVQNQYGLRNVWPYMIFGSCCDCMCNRPSPLVDLQLTDHY